MKTSEIRCKFLNFFAKREHKILPGIPLVPSNDATLLFTNAGMVQFKDVFLGNEKLPYSAATTSQRCLRAGGKHNDLENVGYTTRHHTFFEMLGNFSFNAYFKKEAIRYAWEFLTVELQIPKDKLWVTVHHDDNEAYDIWVNDIKFSASRISKCGDKDNFWAMGDTGPCGPCTEIFYDYGPEYTGNPPSDDAEDGERFIEIWNLVFMQYQRNSDGTLTSLPNQAVDTGMGLERIAAVMQDVHSNYDSDVFKFLLENIAKETECTELNSASLKVIADHLRASVFLILDNISPSNEGRGYVLRRIIRRAIRHGHRLKIKMPFFSKLVPLVTSIMQDTYPELLKNEKRITSTIEKEEMQFAKTLEQGIQIFNSELLKINDKIISGDLIFKLYDTYGFPIDLVKDLAQEKQLKLDISGFEDKMQQQKARARANSQFHSNNTFDISDIKATTFVGYENLEASTEVIGLFDKEGNKVDSLIDEQGFIILNTTPFYSEAGGQVGDSGNIYKDEVTFEVQDTKSQANVTLHYGQVRGEIKIKDKVTAKVCPNTRLNTARNHTATHILHAALKNILGSHVEQKGSLVTPDRLRFDFSHDSSINQNTLNEISALVNENILSCNKVLTEVMPYDEAIKKGAAALFSEKYQNEVRVLATSDNFSIELCGGTHVENTSQIGLFIILSETGIASGTRRIEAITGKAALEHIKNQANIVARVEKILSVPTDKIEDKINQQQQEYKDLKKRYDNILSANLDKNLNSIIDTANKSNANIKIVVEKIDVPNPQFLRKALDKIKKKINEAVIILAAVENDKTNFVVYVGDSLQEKYDASKIANNLALKLDGKGGGRSGFAQGSGKSSNLKQAFSILTQDLKQID